MNVSKTLFPPRARKVLVTAVVTIVAATCVVSANSASAAAGHAKPSLTQATKEWKAPSTGEVVMATKEWKANPLTKEW